MNLRSFSHAAAMLIVKCAALVIVIWASVGLLHQATSAREVASPAPFAVAKAFPGLREVRYSDQPEITAMHALGTTMVRVVKTTAVACSVGLLVGLLLAYGEAAWVVLQPSLDFYRSIPVT